MGFNENKTNAQLLEDLEAQRNYIAELEHVITQLKVNERRYSDILDSVQEVVFEIDIDGKLTYSNKSVFSSFGYERDNIIGRNVLDFIIPEDHIKVKENIMKSLQGQPVGISQYTAQHMDGSRFPIIIHSNPIVKDGMIKSFSGVIRDITEKKKSEEKIQYLSIHDSLTGLYNRAYFEYEMHRCDKRGYTQMGMLMCDLDGLKLVNDTLGHEKGDYLLKKAANLINECASSSDIVARIGGDEFGILVYNNEETYLVEFNRRLQAKLEEYNHFFIEFPMNISVGIAVMNESVSSMALLYKQADYQMYREKLHRRHSMRSNIVHTLSKTLEARDIVTKEHASRLNDLIVGLADAAGVSKFNRNDLLLFAQFHDIGKLGVADRILFKPGPLSYEERLEIQRHSEIGHRIVMSSPDLMPIGEWVLEHHEWWNGQGYPLGLAGDAIPIECRILSIVDAYDAMINDRPYRKGMSDKEAVRELKRCAGTQFDAQLVDIFIQILEREKNEDFYSAFVEEYA